MSTGGGVDFGRRSGEYGAYRPGLPASFYDRLEGLMPLSGARALDVATGPGTEALSLAARGAAVTGIDIAENQILEARRLAEAAGLGGRCTFDVGSAEATGLDAGTFDLATAAQCWHWFDEAAAMAELLRVLRPGGLLVVVHHPYLPRYSPIAEASEAMILRYNPGWTMSGHDGLYPRHVDTLIGGGFELAEQFCYDHDEMFTHEGWRGRMRTSNGVGSGPLSEEEVARFDAELGKLLETMCPVEPFPVRHRVWATAVRRP